MRISLRRPAAAVLSVSFLVPLAVSAAGVEVLFDASERTRTIFPSNLFTVVDPSQNTFRRVNLKHPDCFDPWRELFHDERDAYQALVWQCRYSGIEVPDALWRRIVPAARPLATRVSARVRDHREHVRNFS